MGRGGMSVGSVLTGHPPLTPRIGGCRPAPVTTTGARLTFRPSNIEQGVEWGRPVGRPGRWSDTSDGGAAPPDCRSRAAMAFIWRHAGLHAFWMLLDKCNE